MSTTMSCAICGVKLNNSVQLSIHLDDEKHKSRHRRILKLKEEAEKRQSESDY